MKEEKLREISECNICHKKIGSTGIPLFWRVKLVRYGLKHNAIKRQQGLGIMIGPELAMVMGPDENMTEEMSSKEITVCENCAGENTSIYRMAMED